MRRPWRTEAGRCGFRFDGCFFAWMGRNSDNTLGSRRVFLCVHDYYPLRTVKTALQTATAVVSNDELVSFWNGENCGP